MCTESGIRREREREPEVPIISSALSSLRLFVFFSSSLLRYFHRDKREFVAKTNLYDHAEKLPFDDDDDVDPRSDLNFEVQNIFS